MLFCTDFKCWHMQGISKFVQENMGIKMCPVIPNEYGRYLCIAHHFQTEHASMHQGTMICLFLMFLNRKVGGQYFQLLNEATMSFWTAWSTSQTSALFKVVYIRRPYPYMLQKYGLQMSFDLISMFQRQEPMEYCILSQVVATELGSFVSAAVPEPVRHPARSPQG